MAPCVLRSVLLSVALAPLPIAQQPPRTLPEPLLLIREEVFTARISAIEDGDSVIVQDDRRNLRIHLDGVDAPELVQPYGTEAHALLKKLAAGQVVTVRVTSRGPADRESFARLELKGADLSVAVLQSGLGWYCGRHAEDAELARAEKAARDARRGLWSASNPVRPWQYRGTANCWQETRNG
jgi:endonuclease YncB( thermonuclease family)